MSIREIIEAITVTAELTGTQLSGVAMASMASDLMAEFSEPAILGALSRCRRELSGRLTQSAVVERIEQGDGRPGSNEAWGIAVSAFDEGATVVLSNEIAEAMAAARPVLDSGDEVGARMAFRDAYDRIVRTARANGVKSPTWFPSIGLDPARRVDAIQNAVAMGRLAPPQAAQYLPAPTTPTDRARGAVIAGLLTGNVVQMPNDPAFRAGIEKMKAVLRKEKAA